VDLEAYIEHNEECVSAFLRGFFDSEGCINKSGGLTVCNSDLDLICYVRSLLSKYFDVETTEPRQTHTMGTEIINRGRSYRRTCDVYYLYVRKKSIPVYFKSIGFTIHRKQARLRVYAMRDNRHPVRAAGKSIA
jgi:intein-encoded DNA endonuclease-like protein